MIPDRVIVRKIKQLNPELYLRWNAEREWFELWHKPFLKPAYCVTPVTQSIYDTKRPLSFTPLDERLVWWAWEADFARKGAKDAVREWDSRVREWDKKVDRQRIQGWKDRGKDMWNLANAHYVTKEKPKNDKPKFNNYSSTSNWVRPDSQARTSSRVFTRSKKNALKYNFQKRG